jgi:hypothetical protein
MNSEFNNKELTKLYSLILMITNITLQGEPDDKNKPKRIQDLAIKILEKETLSNHTDEEYLIRMLLELIMNKTD